MSERLANCNKQQWPSDFLLIHKLQCINKIWFSSNFFFQKNLAERHMYDVCDYFTLSKSNIVCCSRFSPFFACLVLLNNAGDLTHAQNSQQHFFVCIAVELMKNNLLRRRSESICWNNEKQRTNISRNRVWFVRHSNICFVLRYYFLFFCLCVAVAAAGWVPSAYTLCLRECWLVWVPTLHSCFVASVSTPNLLLLLLLLSTRKGNPNAKYTHAGTVNRSSTVVRCCCWYYYYSCLARVVVVAVAPCVQFTH